MIDMLQANGITVVGVLLVCLFFVVKMLTQQLEKQEKMNDERYKELKDDYKQDREALRTQLEQARVEIKESEEDRRKAELRREEDSKHWLLALENNTKELSKVADVLGVMPKLQEDVDNIKTDMKAIKSQLVEKEVK